MSGSTHQSGSEQGTRDQSWKEELQDVRSRRSDFDLQSARIDVSVFNNPGSSPEKSISQIAKPVSSDKLLFDPEEATFRYVPARAESPSDSSVPDAGEITDELEQLDAAVGEDDTAWFYSPFQEDAEEIYPTTDLSRSTPEDGTDHRLKDAYPFLETAGTVADTWSIAEGFHHHLHDGFSFEETLQSEDVLHACPAGELETILDSYAIDCDPVPCDRETWTYPRWEIPDDETTSLLSLLDEIRPSEAAGPMMSCAADPSEENDRSNPGKVPFTEAAARDEELIAHAWQAIGSPTGDKDLEASPCELDDLTMREEQGDLPGISSEVLGKQDPSRIEPESWAKRISYRTLAMFAVILVGSCLALMEWSDEYRVQADLLYLSEGKGGAGLHSWSLDKEMKILTSGTLMHSFVQHFFSWVNPAAASDDCEKDKEKSAGSGPRQFDPIAAAGFHDSGKFLKWMSAALLVKADREKGFVELTVTGPEKDFLKSVLHSYIHYYADYRSALINPEKVAQSDPAPADLEERSGALAKIEHQLQIIDTQKKECSLALNLMQSGKGSFSGLLSSDNATGIPELAKFQSKIVELELKKKELLVRFKPGSREVSAVSLEIEGVRTAMMECIREHLFFLGSRKQTLLVQKLRLERNVKRPVQGPLPGRREKDQRSISPCVSPMLGRGLYLVQAPHVVDQPFLAGSREFVKGFWKEDRHDERTVSCDKSVGPRITAPASGTADARATAQDTPRRAGVSGPVPGGQPWCLPAGR